MIQTLSPRPKTPSATYSLIIVFGLLYAFEILFQWHTTGELRSSLTPPILQKLGGATKIGIISNEEWFRAFCAPLYHVNLMHLFSNCMGLYLCGEFLESFIHRSWFLLIFFITALSGVLFGVMILDTTTVSVGASGGIMGLLAAALVLSMRIQERPLQSNVRSRLISPCVATLLPIVPRVGAWIFGLELKPDGIDHGAHLGGALMGILLGVALLSAWPPFEPGPRYLKLARVLVGLYMLVTLLSFGDVMSGALSW